MSEQKEVDDMEKFMTILMDVKVSLAQQNQKLDNVLDMKKKVEQTQVVANEADRVSKQNKKDIKAWDEKMEKKADKDDVERIIKQKDNWHRNLPAWIAVAISVIVFLSQYISI
ncbi:hypothetical protein SAMN05192559_104107 [Halobacillus karajensis]|uniref:hypothetical protein n=1 Tax=Halobacillus karajensis TaxID=195088 RepID=UPI0008A72A6B|nr:hypothetical protein [Halobacillus karajensis]SEH78592.1 hypothetical protein SAMN05192559_104107 [Halobacillus karajensis]